MCMMRGSHHSGWAWDLLLVNDWDEFLTTLVSTPVYLRATLRQSPGITLTVLPKR